MAAGFFICLWHRRQDLGTKSGVAILAVSLSLTLASLVMTIIEFEYADDFGKEREVFDYN